MHTTLRAFAHRGYTLVELFLTLTVVMIVLGMMINLAQRVRHESADRATRQILARLTTLINNYQRTYGQLPAIRPVIDPAHRPTEDFLQSTALGNSADLVRYLNLKTAAHDASNSDDPLFRSLQQTNPAILRDPWGGPIIFMPRQDPAIGIAPGDTFFLCSAGPDGRFLTHDDNVNSYDEMGDK